MNKAYSQGQASALVKLGFGPQDAAKMFKATKKYTAPKSVVRKFERAERKSWGMPLGPATLENTKSKAQKLKHHDRFNEDVLAQYDKAYPPRPKKESKNLFQKIKNRVTEAIPTRNDLARIRVRGHREGMNPRAQVPLPDSPTPKITMGIGNASRFLRKGMSDNPELQRKLKQLTSEDKKMLNAVIKGHEFDEIKSLPRTSFLRMGHNSPDVLLREHNRIKTLPEEFSNVRDTMQSLRQGGSRGELNAMDPYLQYGESPRLSRHARKRITDLIEQDRVNEIIRDKRKIYLLGT